MSTERVEINPDNNNKGEVVESIIKIITDDGLEGHMFLLNT